MANSPETNGHEAQGKCPCGSGVALEACCGPYLDGKALPERAEALMRSRYSAFALQRIDYLRETLWPKYQAGFDAFATARWASENRWVGLQILAVEEGEAKDRRGTVLFEARYLAAGTLHTHREKSLFKKSKGRWYYLEAMPET
ncbi:YchJ family metal-binding protein [uncultured Cohaesibacter sp.]|uniref:YchJ family protein n=1 Tax=uncultured Cohaesibacter sp. TaxID=1002546 RepID=UPI0029C95347|nr:YchJ family metal-binding protein [uncultured Cohaesibacter sp.]